MLRVFNMGIGMIIIIAEKDHAEIMERLGKLGEKAYSIGTIEKKENQSADSRLCISSLSPMMKYQFLFLTKVRIMRKKICIGVLVSGSGSNLQSIIDHIENGTLDAEIRIVISNNSDSYALERCIKHDIPTAAVVHHEFAVVRNLIVE